MPRKRAPPPAAVIRPPRRSRPRRAGRPFNQPRPLMRDLTNHGLRCAPPGQWQCCPSLERANRQRRRRTNSKKARPHRAGAAPCRHVGLAGPGVRGAFRFRARRGRHGEQRRQPERREGDHGRCVTAAGQGRVGCEGEGTPGPAVGRAHGRLSWEEGRGLRLPKDAARRSFCFYFVSLRETVQRPQSKCLWT